MTPSIVALTVLLVTGPHSVSTGELRQIFEKSTKHYAEAGIKLKVKRIYKIRDRYANLETISESERKFYLYRSFVRRVGYGGNGRIHAVLPPMLELNGYRYLGGFAEGSCNGRFSLSNAQRIRLSPDPTVSGTESLTMSGIAFSHELAHTLNAEHNDKTPNIMHSAALQFSGQKIGFLQSTIYRMKRCLGKR